MGVILIQTTIVAVSFLILRKSISQHVCTVRNTGTNIPILVLRREMDEGDAFRRMCPSWMENFWSLNLTPD